jgi:hypothetical protein
MQDYQAMNDRPAETRVTTFLKATLKNAAVSVPKLEVMAREAGLLGERQRITSAKQFRQAKSAPPRVRFGRLRTYQCKCLPPVCAMSGPVQCSKQSPIRLHGI